MPIAPDAPVWLVCLCAAWCRTCDDYAQTLDAVAAEFAPIRLRWIDIEDEAELLGDADVETFPTLLIGCGRQLWFAGPVTPQPSVLRRLLASLLATRTPTREVPTGFEFLARRLAAQVEAEAEAESRKPPTT